MAFHETDGSLELPENPETAAGIATSSLAATVAATEASPTIEATASAETTTAETNEPTANSTSGETVPESVEHTVPESVEHTVTSISEGISPETVEHTLTSTSGEAAPDNMEQTSPPTSGEASAGTMDRSPASTSGETTTEKTSGETAPEIAERTSTSTSGDTAPEDSEQSTAPTSGEIAPDTVEQTTTSTSGETAIATDDAHTAHSELISYPFVPPTMQQGITLFRDLYESILAPAFEHPAWAGRTPGRGQSFPAHTRSIMDMIDTLDPDNPNPELLQDWFAGFVKAFCEDEMHVLSNRFVAPPGEFFDWDKYGFWCHHIWREQWRLAFFVQPVYAYRNEWAWGVDGGTRGLAGFAEAVCLFAHCFCRMLEKSWAEKWRLYRLSCWEMREYLYKWALVVQPPLVPTAPIVAHQPQDSEAAGGQEEDVEDAEDVENAGDAGSVSSDDSAETVRPYGHSSTALDQTDLDLEEAEEGVQQMSWLNLSDGDNEYGTIEIRYDEEDSGEENREIQEPYAGGTEPFPPYTEPFPQYTEQFPQYAEPVPQHTEQFPQYTEPVPQYTEPFLQYTEPQPEYVDVAYSTPQSTVTGTAATQATSQSLAIPATTTTPEPRRGRARAQADAAERADAEDADLSWFAQYVLDREL